MPWLAGCRKRVWSRSILAVFGHVGQQVNWLNKDEIVHRLRVDCADCLICLDTKMMGQSRLLVLVFACGITSAAASAKRGIAKANLQEHQLHALKQGVSWGYNWELNPRMQWSRAQMDFFPMVHNNNFPRNAGGGQFRALLGFNEPDIHHQAAMNPWHAAAIWPEVERVARNYGVKTLVSPAMCGDIGKGTWWMGEFLKACKGCRVDAVAIHSYWCSVSGLQNLVENYKKFGKKIWLTEFACADQNYDVSMQGQIKFMKEVVPWLEQEPAIEKYLGNQIYAAKLMPLGATVLFPTYYVLLHLGRVRLSYAKTVPKQ